MINSVNNKILKGEGNTVNKDELLKTVKCDIRVKFDSLIKSHNLDYKDEIKILAMLTGDAAKKHSLGEVTIVGKQ